MEKGNLVSEREKTRFLPEPGRYLPRGQEKIKKRFKTGRIPPASPGEHGLVLVLAEGGEGLVHELTTRLMTPSGTYLT